MFELHEALLKDFADLILESGDHNETDVYGDHIVGTKIYGAKLFGKVLLYASLEDPARDYIEYDEEVCYDPALVIKQAEQFHNAYYDYLPIRHCIGDPGELQDKTDQILNIIDKFYTPSDDLKPTPPSTVLDKILKYAEYESGREWCWKNEKFYLTQSVGRRTGQTSGSYFFDNSLYSILSHLSFNVEKVRLSFFDKALSLYENTIANKRKQAIEKVEWEIEKKKRHLTDLKKEMKETEEEIMDLHNELNRIKLASDFT